VAYTVNGATISTVVDNSSGTELSVLPELYTYDGSPVNPIVIQNGAIVSQYNGSWGLGWDT
jgi:hypothetical protein